MSITVQCGGCQKTYKLGDDLAGRKVRCKGCGAVIRVPAGDEADDAGPIDIAPPAVVSSRAPKLAKPAPARRVTAAPPPPPPPPDDDPFNNLDGLMGLEDGGTIDDAPPAPVAPRRASRAASAAAAPAPGAPRVPRLRKSGGLALDGGPGGPYFTMGGEGHVDVWVPIGLILFFLGFMIYTYVRMYQALKEVADFFQSTSSYTTASYMKWFGTRMVALLIFTACAGAGVLGTYIGCRIVRAQMPRLVFPKCLAVFLIPFCVSILWAGFEPRDSLFAAPLYLTIPIALGVLWLLYRLKPIPFGIVGGCAGVMLWVLPWAITAIVEGAAKFDFNAIGPVVSAKSYPFGWFSSQQRAPMPAPSRPSGSIWPFGNSSGSTPAPANSRNPAADRAAMTASLQKVGVELRKYADAHGGKYPFRLSELVDARAVTDADIRVPGSMMGLTYEAYNARVPLPANLIVLADPNMSNEGRLMLFGDGRIEAVPPARFGEVYGASMRAGAENRRGR